MPYNQNIPQANDALNNSQLDILNNYIAIQTFLDVNHNIFGDPNEGKHKWVSFPEQGAGPATAVNETAVYAKQSTLTNVAELFVRKENNGAEIEFTSSLQAANGWTRLPSGILLKWGSAAANGTFAYLFPVAATIPVFALIYSLHLSALTGGVVDPDAAITPLTSTAIGFAAYGSRRTVVAAQNVPFTYLAIGI